MVVRKACLWVVQTVVWKADCLDGWMVVRMAWRMADATAIRKAALLAYWLVDLKEFQMVDWLVDLKHTHSM